MTLLAHQDTFPCIADAIRTNTSNGEYIEHKLLVTALLQNAGVESLVSAASIHSKLSKERLASNMVAWFSKTVTTGANPYAASLERCRMNKRWAYRWCN